MCILDTYKQITTFEEFQTLNLAFLKGEITETIYSCGPVEEETLPLLPSLIKLNELGFITLDSQPGTFTKDIFNDEYFIEEQKPYLEGFCRYKDLTRIEECLKKLPVYYRINTYHTDPVLLSQTFPKFPYNLTRDKAHHDPKQLRTESWRHYTNLNVQVYADTFGMNYPFFQDVVFVFIAGKEYQQKINIAKELVEYFD